MEALALIMIGAALFAQSWYLLELYPDGRTMGVFVGGLGLAALVAIPMAPMLLTGQGTGADMATETTVMKVLIVLWAGYAVGVGAHGLWDFDDRAIGFYAAFVAIVSLVALLYFSSNLQKPYGDEVWLALSAPSLLLAILGGMLFFHLAWPFSGLRQVTAWFILVGSIAISGIGLIILTLSPQWM